MKKYKMMEEGVIKGALRRGGGKTSVMGVTKVASSIFFGRRCKYLGQTFLLSKNSCLFFSYFFLLFHSHFPYCLICSLLLFNFLARNRDNNYDAYKGDDVDDEIKRGVAFNV